MEDQYVEMLIRIAYKISTKDYLLEMELDHTRTTFHTVNNFPLKVINRVMREIKQKEQEKSTLADTDAQLKKSWYK